MLVATLALPPSANNLYVNTARGRRLSREGEAYKTGVMKYLMYIGAQSKCPEPPYVLRLWIMVPDRRRRDLSNMVKAIEDALSTYLGYDDTLHHALHSYKGTDRKNPRAVIQLTHKDRSIPAPPDTYRPQGNTPDVLNGLVPTTLLIDDAEFAREATAGTGGL